MHIHRFILETLRSPFLPALLFCGASLPAHAEDSEQVPRTVVQLQSTSLSATSIRHAGQDLGSQSAFHQQGTLLQRWPLAQSPWYLGIGVQAETFSFRGAHAQQPRQLQDVALPLCLQYFVGNTPAAEFSAKPGLYFENDANTRAFDVPLQAITAVPLSRNLNGVIGAVGARFYHHTIPVVGLSWTIRPALRLDAVFPEPALTYTPTPAWEWKLAGELQSGGFHTPSNGRLEYYSYQLKGRVTFSPTRSWKLSGALGMEIERSFDFFDRADRERGHGALLIQLGAEWSL